MAEADLALFRDKIRQLNAFLALSDSCPELGEALRQCSHHDQVVALARQHGFAIGRRWGDPPAPAAQGRLAAAADESAPTNLLESAPPPLGQEQVMVLLRSGNLRLERIHSCGASSPAGFWYEQPEHEWVCLLQGNATLQFEDEVGVRQLRPGDSLTIRSRRRHRVVATDPPPGTLWLALFWQEPGAG